MNRTSKWVIAASLPTLLLWLAASSLLMAAGCSSVQSHSPSYQRGYSMMTDSTRQMISETNQQLENEGKPAVDSPAHLFGSDGHDIARVCHVNLEMATVGSENGNEPKLPDPFSRSDFLSGCTDAGKALLASGDTTSAPTSSNTSNESSSAATATQPTAIASPPASNLPATNLPSADQLSSLCTQVTDPGVAYTGKNALVQGGISSDEGQVMDQHLRKAYRNGNFPEMFDVTNIQSTNATSAAADVGITGPKFAGPVTTQLMFVDQGGTWVLQREAALALVQAATET